jgi:hypothetical protein
MTRRYSSPSLADAAKQLRMLSVTCERCNRFGRYRIDKLIEKYGADITLPELRHELAQCERRHNMSDPCQVGYVERVEVDPNID